LEEQYHITVLLGGTSEEREVSLCSGKAVIQALETLGHYVREVDPKEPGWQLDSQTEVVFLALHGEYGEDGQVQERLEQERVPYTGTGIRGSRIAFDKELTKHAFKKNDIPTPRWLMLNDGSEPPPTGLDAPWVLKPARQGSSVGLQLVDEVGQWDAALAAVRRHDDRILCEERIVGREITVGILADEALPIVEVKPKVGAYHYRNKYTVGATEYCCPADLPPEQVESLWQLGLKAFDAVEGRDFGRVDMMLDAGLKPHVLEVNTLPGLTETSLLPMASAAAGLEFNQLCQRMIELALQRN
jgi:D-alanine-D-alanine ligase